MAEIKQRRLGRTNLMAPELGLGALDTATVPEGEETLRLALDLGIRFIDTARGYSGSEQLIGQVLHTRGATGLHLASKTFHRDSDGAQYDVYRSLQVLGVDKIDLYQLHDVSTPKDWEAVMSEGGALAGLNIAREMGLIDYIGVSCHSLEVLEKAITCGEFDTVMLEYSAFYPQTERLIALARERDVGVIVMRPLGGSGRTSSIRTQMQASPNQVFLTPAMLLRYVLSNPDISVAIPGVRYPSRVRENVELASTYLPLDASQKAECERQAKLLF